MTENKKREHSSPPNDVEFFTREEIAMFEEMMVNARHAANYPLGDYLTKRHDINQGILREERKRNEFVEFWIK